MTCIKNEKNVIVNYKVEKDNIVWIGDISKKVSIGDTVYKTSSCSLNEKYRNLISKINRKVPAFGTINIRSNININMDVKLNNGDIANIIVEYIPQTAVNKQVDAEYVYNQFSKTIDSPFEFTDLKYNIEDNLFVPVSKLNELRRMVISKLEQSYLINIDVKECYNRLQNYIINHNESLESLKSIKLKDEKKLNVNSLFIYKYNVDNEYKYNSDSSNVMYLNISDIRRYNLKNIDIVSKYIVEKDVYIYIPNIVLSNLDKYIDLELENLIKLGVKGILLGNIGYMQTVIDLKNKYDITIVADYSLNIVNTYAVMFLKEKGIDKITISPEIDENEIQNIESITDIEVVENFVTAMTSRFCPVKAYSKGCNCTKNLYELKDNHNNVRYHVVCDNTDCTVKLVRNISSIENNKFNKRKCII